MNNINQQHLFTTISDSHIFITALHIRQNHTMSYCTTYGQKPSSQKAQKQHLFLQEE